MKVERIKAPERIESVSYVDPDKRYLAIVDQFGNIVRIVKEIKNHSKNSIK